MKVSCLGSALTGVITLLDVITTVPAEVMDLALMEVIIHLATSKDYMCVFCLCYLCYVVFCYLQKTTRSTETVVVISISMERGQTMFFNVSS